MPAGAARPASDDGYHGGHARAARSCWTSALAPEQARRHEVSFVEGDGTRLARAGLPRGAGVYRRRRLVDLPGATLQLRVDSAAGPPEPDPQPGHGRWCWACRWRCSRVVLLLARDVRRRARAEAALAEALAFRKAMEDSLITGLRARDLQGRITYVNPAFCAMVGFTRRRTARRQRRRRTGRPSWPTTTSSRQAVRLARPAPAQPRRAKASRRVFMRKNGERFPVMIYEAPLVDGQGRHTGWMSAVLDVSAQRRVEELSRQQQERLQATARLATVGEMASLLSHELNQPLAAIASYATGSLNLLRRHARRRHAGACCARRCSASPSRPSAPAASSRACTTSCAGASSRARRCGADLLIDAVLPLVRLQARKSGTRIELDAARAARRACCATAPWSSRCCST